MKTLHKAKHLQYTLFALIMFFALLLFAPFTLKSATAAAEVTYENAYVGDVFKAEDYQITCDGMPVQAEGLRVVYPSGGVYGGDSLRWGRQVNTKLPIMRR
jgi:hypothetical protein